MDTIRVVVADDHPVVRTGLRSLLEAAPDIAVVGEAANGEEALHLVDALTPDVLLLDVQMPGLSGLTVIQRIHDARVPVRVLILSAFADVSSIRHAVKAGAVGYLVKDEVLDTLVAAVRGAVEGQDGWFSRSVAAQMAASTRRDEPAQAQLTGREKEVLALVAQGWTSARVAQELDIAERTVRFHLHNIYQKFGFSTRSEAIAWALKEEHAARHRSHATL